MDARIIKTRTKIRGGLTTIYYEGEHLDTYSVKDFCKRFKISRNTFYNHYKSLDEVLLDITYFVIKELDRIFEIKEINARTDELEFFCRNCEREIILVSREARLNWIKLASRKTVDYLMMRR